MAKSILDIIIKMSKQGGADKETVKDLVNLKSAIMNAATVAGTLVAAEYAVKKIFDATVGTFVAYADQVRTIQNATGATAEQASRLIQVLDDQKISFDELEKAVAKNGKTFDYSIEGLAKMSEEYLQLTDSGEKAAFMQERFGKNWIAFVPVMKEGGQAIRDASNAVDENLVLTEKAIIQARRWEIQVDNLTDKWEGLKISLGQGILGALDGSTDAINSNAQALFEAATGYQYAGRYASEADQKIWEESKKVAEQEWVKKNAIDAGTASTDAAAQSAEEYAAALKATSEANTSMLSLIMQLQNENDSYTEKLEAQRAKLAELTTEQANFTAGSEDWNQYQEQINETTTAIDALAAEHEAAGQKIAFSLLQAKLAADGFTDAEFNGLLQIGLQWGIVDQAVVDAATSMNTQMNQIADGMDGVEYYGNGATNSIKNFGQQSQIAGQKMSDPVSQLTVMTDQLFTAKELQGTYAYNFLIKTSGTLPDFGSLNGASGSRRHGGEVVFAEGSDGWKTVPSGYPNDSYPIFLTSGERFAVVPNGQSDPINAGSAQMMGAVSVTVNVSSFLSLADQNQAEAKLKPIIQRAIRDARGVV